MNDDLAVKQTEHEGGTAVCTLDDRGEIVVAKQSEKEPLSTVSAFLHRFDDDMAKGPDTSVIEEDVPSHPQTEVDHQTDSDATGKGFFSESILTETPSEDKNRILRKLKFACCSHYGSSIVAVAALFSALWLQGYSQTWVFEATAVLVLIRLGYYLTRGPKPVLETFSVRKNITNLLFDEAKISVFMVATVFIVAWPVDKTTIGIFLLANVAGQLAHLAFTHTVMRRLKKHSNGDRTDEKRVLIVGTGDNARKVADMILASPETETKLVGFLDYRKKGFWSYRDVPLVGRPESFEEFVANGQVDALFVAVQSEDLPHTESLFETAEQMGVTVCLMPDVYRPTLSRVRPASVNGLPTLIYRAVPENRTTLLLKDVIDRTGAAFGVLLTAPIMIAVAILIKLDSKGPVFFKQVRSGINGKLFYLYKFRTMVCDAEKRKAELMAQNEMSGPVFKIKTDPRITKIGAILRKFSIDELPQFFNVLKGDMSLVGPRPPLPKEVARFEPWQHRKLSVKPGVTCTWQVTGRNSIDFDDWMRLDLQYIDNWSLWQDAKILARTIPAVVKGTGS